MKKMNPVVHFELPADDTKRMAAFYGKVFGWEAKHFGPEMGNYVTVMTTETDEKHMIKTPGHTNGGLFPRMKDAKYPTVVIAVDDINKSMKEIVAAGGRIVSGMKPGEPDDIPQVGLYVSFEDTEGNRIAILQPKQM